jgi:hypothetical protein
MTYLETVQQNEFRFRTGDRYLGHAVWEHYLGFEQLRTSSKAIRLSMIRLGNEDLREEVVIRPGFRLRNFESNQRHHDGSQRRKELDRAGGSLTSHPFWLLA